MLGGRPRKHNDRSQLRAAENPASETESQNQPRWTAVHN
jgi:hypothetical protein